MSTDAAEAHVLPNAELDDRQSSDACSTKHSMYKETSEMSSLVSGEDRPSLSEKHTKTVSGQKESSGIPSANSLSQGTDTADQRAPDRALSQESLDSSRITERSPGKDAASHRVSIAVESIASALPPKRVSSSRARMERELTRMSQADENERLRQKDTRQKEVKTAIAAVYDRKKQEGVTLTPDVEASRSAIKVMMREEERMALEKEQKKLRRETKALQQQIDEKYGLKQKKQGHDLLALADDFYHGKVKDKDGLPEQVRRELTRVEIEDLRMVFEMFDIKGRGYITANDVKRAASMLGFKAKKEVFSEMIEEVTGNRNGKVTFVHFLQFVMKGQGDGDDPLEAILQCFRLLDQGQKGYVTADDLRSVADTQKLPLSNRAIREMIQEADVTGDAKVTSDEFIHLMLQSSMFRTTR